MFKVMVGNGNYMTVEGLIQQLVIQAQGNLFQNPVYLLPISGADLILGASWLKTIDPHVADYESLHLKFLYNGNMKMVDPNTPSFTSLELLSDIEPEVALLLTTYALVFSTPSTLPPPHEHDHSIPLMDGSTPVKVKPYRYPHSQKEEIEKLVAEMLHEGIIQPSKSPFSSPIILVKKKDGSWRVCTDYRALNAITIKDSFSIPTVDELIDELFGATIFSKLDL
uniref:Transposon Ty3-I Gag-Pol polyprotein n=1 Tax=Cajanus cajan TaxID=3821 RepID=A0A151RUE7_CAJCA|nr:Transposon Ty3-I Gag-Pol polyprotein [Cajanus cajan]